MARPGTPRKAASSSSLYKSTGGCVRSQAGAHADNGTRSTHHDRPSESLLLPQDVLVVQFLGLADEQRLDHIESVFDVLQSLLEVENIRGVMLHKPGLVREDVGESADKSWGWHENGDEISAVPMGI